MFARSSFMLNGLPTWGSGLKQLYILIGLTPAGEWIEISNRGTQIKSFVLFTFNDLLVCIFISDYT